jgi:fructoselysine 6-kinase
MKIAAVGFNCVDIYENLQRLYPTGNGIDFVIHMSRFGLQTSVISVVGDDEYGLLMVDTLKKEGIELSHLRVEAGNTAVIKMQLNGNDRVHGELIEGVMKDFSLTTDDIEYLKKFDYIHTDLFGKVIDLLPTIRSNGSKVIFDFSTYHQKPEIKTILPHVDYAFFSYDQHDEYIEEFMKEAKSIGLKLVTVTIGENGSLSYDGTTFYKEAAIKVDVVNTVGAGDSFIAGFMFGVINGFSVQDCLKNGAKTAAGVIAKFEPY